MKRKKPSLYDSHEKRILQQSTAFAEFLTRKGAIEDFDIEDEEHRIAKQNATKKAYHNTEVLLEQYRTIVWVLECAPGELAEELKMQTKDVDELINRIDFEMTMENKRLESRLNTIIKTRILLERVQEALSVLRKKPENGEMLYRLIYDAYLDPKKRTAAELVYQSGLAYRTYYRMRAEARAMRTDAHRLFDQLYLKHYMPKKTAYAWLSATLGVPIQKAHIGLLSELQCELVIRESKKLLAWHEAHRKSNCTTQGRLENHDIDIRADASC